ncbi:Hypothetical predicted protein [Paramuricea clavata]|uniref:Uncharacterized protein n=1 Tax=Paramuricea clavata TaxID=317549 RepID=A0A6S7HBE0_PARCT|nr:Hypothetical predicted protein [Paramuricea clavata]
MALTNFLRQSSPPTKATSPDGIPAYLLKRCSEVIAPSLLLSFELSLQQGVFPSEWKAANVVPIPKKGDTHEVTNYRPVSLLSQVSKVLERLIFRQVSSFVENSLYDLQHSFSCKRLCVTQLLSVLRDLGRTLDSGKETDLIYLDFAKAFDSVSHSKLLFKLKSFGISGPLLNWFADYLRDRKQCVVVEGASSSFLNVTSGVPQEPSRKRLHNVNRKLKQNQQLKDEYQKIVHQQLKDGVIEKTKESSTSEHVFYMPHKPVIKENASTTKILNVYKDLKQIPWSIFDTVCDGTNACVDEAVFLWERLFLDVANLHAPIQLRRTKGHKTPRVTSKLVDARRDLDYHHKKARRSNSKYQRLKSECFCNLINESQVNIGVPRGSVLGPLFFLIYINDLAECLQNSKAALFADDTAIYCSATSAADLQLDLNEDLKIVSKWMETNKLTLNVSKTKLMVAKRLGLLKRVKHLLPRQSRELVYKTVIQPVLEYGDIVDRFNNTLMERLQVLQIKAAKVILDRPLYSLASDAFQTLGWKSLSERRRFHRSCMVFKSFNALIDFNCNQIHLEDFKREATEILEDAKFPVHEWESNVEALDNESNPSKIVGHKWSKREDTLEIRAEPTKEETPVTKRLSSIHDPLGIISPTMVEGKRTYREGCVEKVGWNSEVSTSTSKDWIKWRQQLRNVKIPGLAREIRNVLGGLYSSNRTFQWNN